MAGGQVTPLHKPQTGLGPFLAPPALSCPASSAAGQNAHVSSLFVTHFAGSVDWTGPWEPARLQKATLLCLAATSPLGPQGRSPTEQGPGPRGSWTSGGAVLLGSSGVGVPGPQPTHVQRLRCLCSASRGGRHSAVAQVLPTAVQAPSDGDPVMNC